MFAASDQPLTPVATKISDESTDWQALSRRVMLNQWLWTSGYTLTSGGFLLYFAKQLGAVELTIAVLLVLPELSGVSALLARPLIRLIGSRKRTFIGCSLLARGLLICVPLWGFQALRPNWTSSLGIELGLLVAIYGLHAIAYTAYLSWLAALAPEARWGRFFARRNVAKVLALLMFPVAGALLRDSVMQHESPAHQLFVYEVAFSVGIALMVLSLVPMWRVPDVPLNTASQSGSGQFPDSQNELSSLPEAKQSTSQEHPRVPVFRRLTRIWTNRSLRSLLLHSWCLAFANGLTQKTFFDMQFELLAIGLVAYHLLNCVMRIVKIPVSLVAGRISDRWGNKRLLVVSLCIASSGLLFWLPASRSQPWWIWGGYLSWGIYAAANIAGRNWLLSLAESDDRVVELALFQHVGGVCAGIAGLLGGFWLADLQHHFPSGIRWGPVVVSSFHVMILLSLFGRWASLIWLIRARDPHALDSP